MNSTALTNKPRTRRPASAPEETRLNPISNEILCLASLHPSLRDQRLIIEWKFVFVTLGPRAGPCLAPMGPQSQKPFKHTGTALVLSCSRSPRGECLPKVLTVR